MVRSLRQGTEGHRKSQPSIFVLGRSSGATTSRIAISPDAKWVAAATWGSGTENIGIWDVPSGKRVRDLAAGHGSYVAFSPDGRWLVAGTEEAYRFWSVGSWQPVREIMTDGGFAKGALVFADQARLLALSAAPEEVRLIDALSGRQWATLPAHDPVCFSADGGLLVTGSDNQHIQVWDLRRIREQLATIDLDGRPVDLP